jgi:hypothetical protein
LRIATQAALATSAVLLAVGAYNQLRHPKPVAAQPAADAITLRVVFGYQRAAAKTYDGSVRATGGVVRAIEPWRFLNGDAVTGADSWKLRIRRITFENQPDAPQSMAGGPFPQNIVPAGIFVTVDSTASSLDFQAAQGSFSARLADASYGRVFWFLDGDVQVERVPTSLRISPKNAEEHDFPSIAVTRSGEVWTAWQAYQDRGDHVYVRRQGGEPIRLTTEKGDIFRTSVAEDADGGIHVCGRNVTARTGTYSSECSMGAIGRRARSSHTATFRTSITG